jgi:NAD(P)H-hydrate epimerase
VQGRHRSRPVAILCGPGNNGGDGFVAARHLQEAGWPVRVGLLGARSALKGDAAWAAQAWRGPVEALATGLLEGRPLVVDALFGAGLTRPIEGVAGEAIDRINNEALTVVAVDVPSGLHGDSGEVMGRAPFAERTVTFFRAKPGHYSLEGLRRCGVLTVADIGIPRAVLEKIAPQTWLNGPALWRQHLRRDGLADHKYARGHLTILGGATATGAARLAALAGRRAGAGLATIATPRSAMAIYQAGEPGNLVVECEDGGGFARLLEDGRRNSLLIGPGAGVNERTRASVLAALATLRAVVLDADAITTFAQTPASLFDAIKGPALLTPHEGEFRRLFPDLAKVPSKVERVRRHGALEGPRYGDRRTGRPCRHQHSRPGQSRHRRFGRRAGGHGRGSHGPRPGAARRRCGRRLAPRRERLPVRPAGPHCRGLDRPLARRAAGSRDVISVMVVPTAGVSARGGYSARPAHDRERAGRPRSGRV